MREIESLDLRPCSGLGGWLEPMGLQPGPNHPVIFSDLWREK